MNVNKVVVMGRLTHDPEVRQSGNGKAYSRVSVAVNRPRAKDAAESVADFIDCVAFGERAEFLGKHFRKGAAIIIFGTLRTATRAIGDKRSKRQMSLSRKYSSENQRGTSPKRQRLRKRAERRQRRRKTETNILPTLRRLMIPIFRFRRHI